MWSPSAFVMPLMRGADATLYAGQTDYITQAEYEAAMAGTGTIRQDADYPRLFSGNQGNVAGSSIMEYGSNNYVPQSKYLINMAYLRLKNLTVGYTLPQKWTRKATIEKVRIYASFNNLADLVNHTAKYGFDPEVSAGRGTGNITSEAYYGRTEPLMRSYSFGLQITL